jgi:glycosyltransferase involved in cell wall biosynthesis
MIRVAMITDFPVDEGVVDGGVQAVARNLVKALAQSGEVSIDVICFRYGADRVETLDRDGYRLHLLPGGRLGAVTAYRQDQRTLNRLLAELSPDVVHSQGVGHDGTVAARSGYPVVTTIHGIFAEEAKHLQGFQRRIRHKLLDWLSEHYCIRHARHTILISPYVAAHWGDKLSGDKYMIANPIATEFFDVQRNEEKGRVLFAGRLYQLKGVHDLVQAVGEIAGRTPVKLVLAGSTDDREYVNGLRAAADRLGVSDQIEFAGILNARQLLAEYARASVLVLPSYQETAPMVIQEAMACGVPVIATRVGGIRYQVDDGESGYLLKPGDVAGLSDRLFRLLSNDELRQKAGQNARSKANEAFRGVNVAKDTIDVYRRMLGENQP